MNFLPPWARTLFSLIFIASIVTFSLYVSLYTSLLPENINQSLINGVATSIIGSFVFLGLLFILKPNLKISPNIAHYESIEGDKAGGQDAFVFKIVNKSWLFSANDVHVQLFHATFYNVADGRNIRFEEIDLRKSRSKSICGKCFKRSEAGYAHLFATNENIRNVFNNNSDYLMLQVSSKHSLSGFSKMYQKDFYHANCISRGTFAFGDKYKVI